VWSMSFMLPGWRRDRSSSWGTGAAPPRPRILSVIFPRTLEMRPAQTSVFWAPHDVVMAFSASGNSENVIRAIKHANERKATTIGFTGFDGGRLKEMVDLCVLVPSDCIEQVEDIHLILEHMITREVRALGMQAAGQEVPIGRAGMVRWDREHVRNLYETSRQLIPLMERVEDIRLVLRLMIDRLAGKSGSILVMDRDGAVIGAAVAHDGEIRDLSQEDAQAGSGPEHVEGSTLAQKGMGRHSPHPEIGDLCSDECAEQGPGRANYCKIG